MEDCIQVSTTSQNKQDAEKIATALLQKRLAACVQIVGPISSAYWWKGSIETAQEWLCLSKTVRRLYSDLEKAIQAIHPYETREIVALPIVAGSEEYLGWLARELTHVKG